MLTTEELRRLRDEKVFGKLSKRLEPKASRSERKRGPRPLEAKMASKVVPVKAEAEKAGKPPEVKRLSKKSKK